MGGQPIAANFESTDAAAVVKDRISNWFKWQAIKWGTVLAVGGAAVGAVGVMGKAKYQDWQESKEEEEGKHPRHEVFNRPPRNVELTPAQEALLRRMNAEGPPISVGKLAKHRRG